MPFPSRLQLPLNLGGLASWFNFCQTPLTFELKLLNCFCSILRKGLHGIQKREWERDEGQFPKMRLPGTTAAPGYSSSSHIHAGCEYIVNSGVISVPCVAFVCHFACEADDHMCFVVELCKHGEMDSVVLYITWPINKWEMAVLCSTLISDIDLRSHQCIPSNDPSIKMGVCFLIYQLANYQDSEKE